VLFEGNSALMANLPASNGNIFLHPKDDTNDLTIRNNVFVGQAASSAIGVSNQITLTKAENQEVCWNRIVYDGDQNVDAAIAFNNQTTTPDAENTYLYRNSVVSQRRDFRFYGATPPIPVVFEANAHFGAQGTFGGNYVTTEHANVGLEETDFDAEGHLIGDALDMHGGHAGADIIARE